MKNLFTLCACAFFAITLSAQESDQAAGSFYLGTGDATTLINIFHSDISFEATVGYAIKDGLVVSGSINTNSYMDNFAVDEVKAVDAIAYQAAVLDNCGVVSQAEVLAVDAVEAVEGIEQTYSDAINLNISVRYFTKGMFIQAGLGNLLTSGDIVAEGEDAIKPSIELGVGKYFSLGAVSDRFYVDPQINYNFTNGFETRIGLGCRF